MRNGRVVVVTGAAGGIGRPVVERFLANGDKVLATDISVKALDILAEGQPREARLRTMSADVSSEADCGCVADTARESYGRIDVLVNVAGWYPVQPYETLSAADFRKVVDVNLTGVFLMVKAMTPLLRGRSWGRIVIVGSASAYEGVADQVHYVAAKAGLFGLSRSLARVLGNDGITVNVVTPGLTLTPKALESLPTDLADQQVALRALPRKEVGADLVGAIFFLASPDADFISGQTINVDGGKHML